MICQINRIRYLSEVFHFSQGSITLLGEEVNTCLAPGVTLATKINKQTKEFPPPLAYLHLLQRLCPHVFVQCATIASIWLQLAHFILLCVILNLLNGLGDVLVSGSQLVGIASAIQQLLAFSSR